MATVGKWQRAQRKAAESLLGAQVLGWHGVEMAIRETGSDGLPEFEADEVDCLQLWSLQINTDHSIVKVSTCQSNDLWALQINKADTLAPSESTGIFRNPSLTELPLGEIETVTVRTTIPDSHLAEIVIEIAGNEVVLVAGEIEEQLIGPLVFSWLDESILVFTSSEAVNAMAWTSPRQLGSSFTEGRHPPRLNAPIPTLLLKATGSTAIGEDITAPELIGALGLHIERLWRTHLDEIDDWPDGHTTDGSSIHLCYRLSDDVIEAFGTTFYNFGPEVFAFRARFRPDSETTATVSLAVEPPGPSGGPTLHSDSPVVIAKHQPGIDHRVASLAAAGHSGPLKWVDVFVATEGTQR